VFAATIDELRPLGHEGIAPALPLDDPGAHPSDHAAAVAAALPGDAEVVVVAQSLGAFAGPLVAEHRPVAALILVSPMIPVPGETAGEWWENTGHGEAIAELVDRLGPPDDWDSDAMTYVFLHDAAPEAAAAGAEYEAPLGPGMFNEPWPLERWPDIPTRVLAPRDDRFFPLEFQRRITRERLGIEVDEMDGGHVPMVSRPAELAARLDELARDVRETPLTAD
jgi:pimeloyl-ACP methyl ester carboxylesterase